MGLDIVKYSYSYGTLHRLREWAHEQVAKSGQKYSCYNSACGECLNCWLDTWDTNCPPSDVSKIKFRHFLIHSDCEGYYIGGEIIGIKPGKYFVDSYWGDLDCLKEEVEELNKHKSSLSERLKDAWHDFYADVIAAKDILEFS